MLTFISGWRSPERDKAILNHRDPSRRGIFFVDNQSSVPTLLQYAPLIELWRHGRADFTIGEDCETLVRLNHDTDFELLTRAVTHSLLTYPDTQVIVTYDSAEKLSRLYPALRTIEALVAVDERFDAPTGDRVLFTRGGSFRWRDHIIESQTSLLTEEEVLDAGIVPDPDDAEDGYAPYDLYVDLHR
jgi:hypothetical protein